MPRRKIFNNISNKRKSTIPPLFDGFKVVTSAHEKFELLANSFACNCSSPEVSNNFLSLRPDVTPFLMTSGLPL